MPKLTQRAMKPDFFFTDGRLLAVSREARMLAMTLECLAGATGCVKRDAREIRAAVGYWLAAQADGDAPELSQIDAWIEELLSVTWAVEDHAQAPSVLYLKGFGDRQQSQYVYIGASANGVLQPYLKTPCVDVKVHNVTKKEEGKPVFRGYPEHCAKPYACCPCDALANGIGPDPVQTDSGASSESGSESESGTGRASENVDESNRGKANRSGSSRANLDDAAEALLREFEGWRKGGFSREEVLMFTALCGVHGIAEMKRAVDAALRECVTSPSGLTAYLAPPQSPKASVGGKRRGAR